MVVISVRMKIIKKIILFVLMCVIISLGILIFKSVNTKQNKAKEPVKLCTNSDIVLYLSKCGFLADDKCLETKEITIPSEFNETYLKYNDLQLKQGFDLSSYKGQQATKYTYKIKNHPQSQQAVATLIVYQECLIGADVTLLDTSTYEVLVNNPGVVADKATAS